MQRDFQMVQDIIDYMLNRLKTLKNPDTTCLLSTSILVKGIIHSHYSHSLTHSLTTQQMYNLQQTY